MVQEKLASEKKIKITKKMVTNGVAVRAEKVPMIAFDTEFRDGSSRDIPGVQKSHIWTFFLKDGRERNNSRKI